MTEMESNTALNLPRHLARVLAGNIDGRTNNVRYRQQELQRLQQAVLSNLDEFKQLILEEAGHTFDEVQTEVTLALREIHTHYGSLDPARSLEVEYRTANGKDNIDQKKAAGIVYIIPTQYTLFYSTIAAVSSAIASGNCIILELPNITSSLPSFLGSVLQKSLDEDTFVITNSRPDDEFLRSTLVLSQDLQPGDLKTDLDIISPKAFRNAAIVDRTANLGEAAAHLVVSRFAFNGRSPYAPDVIFVNEFCAKSFIDLLIKEAPSYLSRGLQEHKQMPGRGNQSSLLSQVVSDESCRVIISGTGWAVAQVHDQASHLLKAKIDGRLILIHTVSSLDDAINFCNSMGPLNASFTFAAPAAAKYVSESIDAGMAWINHVPYDMLVGPVIPHNTAPAQEVRYPSHLFQVSRAQVLHRSSNTCLAGSLLLSAGSTDTDKLIKQLTSPLSVSERHSGDRLGFFEQGFVTGGALIFTSLLTASIAAGYHFWKMQHP